MNYKDVLIDAQGSAVAAYTTFLYQYYQFDDVAACFVEGQDYQFYNNRVEDVVSQQYEVLFYPCNGRNEVEKVKTMFSKNCKFKKNVKFLYFADKDYDLKERKEGIYYTDYYSIENFYCQREFIIRVLKDVFNINKYNPDYDICMGLFDEKYSIYYNEILKINSFAYAIRLKEITQNLKGMDFNKIKFENMLINKDFDNFEMKQFDYLTLREFFNPEVDISEEEYNYAFSKISLYNLRGKWELKFFIWFLNNLKVCINNGKYNLSKNERIKMSFDHLMSITALQAITTENLINYIQLSIT